VVGGVLLETRPYCPFFVSTFPFLSLVDAFRVMGLPKFGRSFFYPEPAFQEPVRRKTPSKKERID
jgi:hypothetical protein